MVKSTLRFIQRLWVLTFVGMAFCAGEPALAASGPGDVVGKVTVGYQAWFGAIGDGSPQNDWWHWADNGGEIFSPSNAQDQNSWPDMTDYTVSYQTGFANLGNGQPAKVFSSYDQSTVNAQISWMQQNGIDTIALQRFDPNTGETNRDGEAERTNAAAITYGRKWFVMYDITGWTNMDTELKTDWTTKMSAYTSSSAYAHQNGKPVVCVWLATSTVPVSQQVDIVNWLKSQGLYVIVGTERAWRTDTAKLPIYNAANMIQPWMIGSIGNISDADNNYTTYEVPDEAYCQAHGLDYQDVVLPGDLHLHQRVHGNLMWEMFYNAVRLPAQGIYISMYDEYGEGNMIAKTPDTNAGIPVGSTYLPLNEDGTYCTKDYYLRLTGAGGRMLKGLMPLSVVRPTNPGGAQRLLPGATVALKAVVNGDYVCGGSSSLIANCTADDQQDSFQVVDAGNGNIALRSLANNDYVTAGSSSLIANGTTVGTAETFTEVDAGNGNIGLLAMANDKYVTTGSGGTSPLIASSTSVGSSESFTVVAGTASATGPFGGTPAAVPGTVLAENYDTGGQGVAYNVTSTNGTDNGYRSDGVDLETATSPATGNDLGWTTAGQWFKYTVNVATAGTYKVSFLVAGDVAVTDAFHLSNSSGTNLSGSVNVPSTGGWQAWTTVTATVTLPAGTQTLTLNEDNAGWNIDSIAFASTNSEGPFGGTPAAIPGTVKAENYDTGGQGVAYHVTSANGTDNGYRSDGVDLETATSPATGNDLGWTAAGQWFKYTVNVATAGTYKISFLVAGDVAVTDAFHLSNSSGTNLSGSVNVPSTGGWQDWTTVTATVTLPAGAQTLTLNEDSAGWNIDSAAFAVQ
jgi:Carbohydrate binding module (family 6)